MNVLGIMNGTSIDGVDLVLCRISRTPLTCKLLGHMSFEFPLALQNELRLAAKHELQVDRLAKVHHGLGRFYSEICAKAVRTKKWKIDLVGLHGQTVFHAPPEATLQIGEAAYLRASLNVPVVSDFRVLDLALGGQAAPLATLFHQKILAPLTLKKFKVKSGPVAIQNLGGIGNVSFFSGKKLLAFDTGPANMLIDLAVSHLTQKQMLYDKNGTTASKGLPVVGLVSKWLKHPYFNRKPPKSCGREEFGESFLVGALGDLEAHTYLNSKQKLSDSLATLTEFTAVSIADSYSKFLPTLPFATLLCGGGAKNLYLKSRIQYHLPKSHVITTDDLGWPAETIEGAAFALLAAFRVWGLPSNLPETTGAKRAQPLGKVL